MQANRVMFRKGLQCVKVQSILMNAPTRLVTNGANDQIQNSKPGAQVQNEREEFQCLLRNSAFINMGDPQNKVVEGKIFHVVKNDLYIDFGWKFYCVCARPVKNGQWFVRGSKVLIRIISLELSTRFIGSQKDLTLLEADGYILKLIQSPFLDKQK